MAGSFLNAVHQGDNHWGSYLTGIVAILIYWLRFAGIFVLTLETIFVNAFGLTDLGIFIAIMGAFPPVLAIIYFIVVKLHHRPFQSLINANATINLKRTSLGFLIWLLQLTVFAGLDIWLTPQSYAFNFNLTQWLLLFILATILIPIQTSTEEFLFRGYLMQGLGLITRSRLVLIGVTSLAFALPHFGNPEMQRGFIWGALAYFLWGVFFATITLKDNGLELALGCHAANNLFATLIVNTPDSAIPTTALWTYGGEIDARVEFVGLLIQTAVFYFIFFGGISRQREPPHPTDQQ